MWCPFPTHISNHTTWSLKVCMVRGGQALQPWCEAFQSLNEVSILFITADVISCQKSVVHRLYGDILWLRTIFLEWDKYLIEPRNWRCWLGTQKAAESDESKGVPAVLITAAWTIKRQRWKVEKMGKNEMKGKWRWGHCAVGRMRPTDASNVCIWQWQQKVLSMYEWRIIGWYMKQKKEKVFLTESLLEF